MAEKRYYWLKLKNDFFSQPKIKKLRRIAGGDTYTIIYLKLQLLSLQQEGRLVFEGIEDTFVDEVALTIDEDVENVRVTLNFLVSQGLLEELTSTEFMLPETVSNIGSESSVNSRVKKHRELKKQRELLQCNNDVTTSNNFVTQSKSKEIEKDTEKENTYKKDSPKKKSKQDLEKEKINSILDEYEGKFSESVLDLAYQFFADRVNRGDKVTETQVQMQLEEFAGKKDVEIIASIKTSIASGYKGIFFSNNQRGKRGKKTYTDTAHYTEEERAHIDEMRPKWEEETAAKLDRMKKRLGIEGEE